MSDMTVVFTILALTVALFVHGRLPSDVVAIGSLLALYLSGLVSVGEAFAGFSNSTVVLIGALFVVGEGLTRTGVTAWAGERLIAGAAGRPLRLLVLLMAGTAGLSAFVSNTGTVATLMPAVVIAAWGVRSVPSRFLIPLAFAANAGGVLTLTGTPPNVVVAESLESHGYRPFEFFEYAYIGLPLLVTAVLYMVLGGQRLLPKRASRTAPQPLGGMLEELVERYAMEGSVYRLRVLAGSPLIDRSLEEQGFEDEYGLRVLHVGPSLHASPAPAYFRGPASPVGLDQTIREQSIVVVSGAEESVHRAEVELCLGILPFDEVPARPELLVSRELGVAEVLLTPRSGLIGQALPAKRLRDEFDLVLLGGRRGAAALDPDGELAFGDSFLVRGTWEAIGKLDDANEDLVVVGRPAEVAARVADLSLRSGVAVACLAAMVALMVSGWVPVAVAALLAAGGMILTGCIGASDAYGAVSWSTVMLIAGMLPMATALETSGGAKALADLVVLSVGGIGPLAVMAAIFLVTTSLSQVMSNTATAVLMSPIVLKVATEMGVAPHPLMMTIAVAASTAFLTPIGTTTNLMVLGPGEYRFGDYAKVGAPLVAIFLLLCLVLIPWIWPLAPPGP